MASTALQQLIEKDQNVIRVIMDLQHHGFDLIWYVHHGEDRPGLLGATQTGLLYGATVPTHGDSHAGERRRLLESWYERIAEHFEQVLQAQSVGVPAGGYVHYPHLSS